MRHTVPHSCHACSGDPETVQLPRAKKNKHPQGSIIKSVDGADVQTKAELIERLVPTKAAGRRVQTHALRAKPLRAMSNQTRFCVGGAREAEAVSLRCPLYDANAHSHSEA